MYNAFIFAGKPWWGDIMTKKAVLINDLSGLGKCSLTASIAVLSIMGVQPCPMPTAVFTNQTGYPSFYCDDFSDKLSNYITQWKSLGFEPDGIYTGFLSNEKQVDFILEFIKEFKKPDTLIMVDPVMGDNGRKYRLFTDALAEKMKKLVSKAHIITPNLTECCILCDCDYDKITSNVENFNYLETIKALGNKLIELYDVKAAVITGIIQNIKGISQVCNMAVTRKDIFTIKSPMIGKSYSGTGDLFASVVFAGLLRGEDLNTTISKAVSFIEASLKDTLNVVTDRNDGIEFEKHLSMLL